MSVKQIMKIITDIAMTVLLLLLMSYSMIGEAAHEWLGIGMFVLFIFHHILNRKWSNSLFKGKYTSYRILQTALVALALVSMLGSMVSGIIISRNVFSFLRVTGFLIAGYGVYAFFKREIGSYMFLKNQFAFFNYNEPLILFLLDYIAVMGLFVLIGHYVGQGMKWAGRVRNSPE